MRYRHLRRTTIAGLVTVAGVLILALGVARVLTSARVRDAVARWGVARIGAATGARIHVDQLQWGLFPPRIIVRGVDIEGKGFACRAARASATLGGIYVAHRSIELGTVTARHVVLTLTGITPSGRHARPWFRLHIRHLGLDDVTIAGTHLPGGFGVRASGIRAGWAGNRHEVRGFAIVPRATLSIPGLTPLPVELQTRFTIAQTVSFPHWHASGAGFNLDGAIVSGSGRARVTWHGRVDLQALDRLIAQPELLQGRCRVIGSLSSTGKRPLIRTRIRSPRLVAAGFEIRGVDGRLKIQDGRLSARLERGEVFGGPVSGTYTLTTLGPPFPHRVHLDGSGIDLAAFLRHLGVPDGGLRGRIAAGIDLAWNGERIGEGHGRTTCAVTPAPGALPVHGTVTISLDGNGMLQFAASGVRIGSSLVDWQGPLALGTWTPAWSIHATSAQVPQLARMVNGWIGSQVIPPGLGGTCNVQASLAGAWDALHITFRMEAAPLTFAPLTLDRVVLDASIADQTLTIRHAAYRLGHGGGDVTGGLTWRPTAGEHQLDLMVSGHDLPAPDIAAWFGAGHLVAGSLAFTGGLRGSIAAPLGSWALGFQQLSVGPERLGNGSATIDLDAGVFSVHGLTCDGGISGHIAWNIPDMSLNGTLKGSGLPTHPFGRAATALIGTRAAFTASFAWMSGHELTGHAALRGAGGTVEIELGTHGLDAAASLTGAAHAQVHLVRASGGVYEGPATIDITSVAALIDRFGPSGSRAVLHGRGHGSFSVRWKQGELPRVTGVLDRLDLELGGIEGHLAEPAKLTFGRHGFQVEELWLRGGQRHELFITGRVGPDGSLVGHLTGNTDIRLVRLFLPEWEPAGRVRGVLEMSGSIRHPRFDGIAQVRDASFRFPGSQIILSGITGTLLLAPGRATLDGMTFRMLSGRGTAEGSILLQTSGPDLELAGHISNVQFPIFPGLSPRLSGNWSVRGSPDTLLLKGDLTIGRTRLRRSDTPAEILADWFGNSTGGTLPDVPRLDLTISADHTIDARNAFMRMVGSAALHITGTPRTPGLVGKVEIGEGGQLTIQGVTYTIDRCVITFSDPSHIEPHFDVQARASIDMYDITINVTGTAERLIPTFTSDPPLAQEDVIALLATGHRTSREGGGPGLGLAGALLSQSLTKALDRRARSLLAVDQVRIDPFAESSTGNATARVTIVKQLGPHWTVALESNLTANREAVIFSRWTLAPQVFLEATRQRDGSMALDLKIRKRY